MIALAIGIAVAAACASSLLALRMWLAHKEKALVHAPLAQLEQRMSELENRLLGAQLNRR